jgi:transcriptional regulator with XRE-family HTH domain
MENCVHRTKKKNVTKEAALLKRLRANRNLSMPQVASLIGKSVSWISHVENGRMDVTEEHVKLLVPLYGQTLKSFQSYLTGAALIDSASRKECIDTVSNLPEHLIESLYPLLKSMKELLPAQPDREKSV